MILFLVAAVTGVDMRQISVSNISVRPVIKSAPLRHAVRICMSESAADQPDSSDLADLYASLSKRRSQLSATSEKTARERSLIKALGEMWPASEKAQAGLWEHWYNEEGAAARESLVEAEGKAAALEALIEDYPDWVEPANRLATLKYMDGDYEESIMWCRRILRKKPWHFGAGSGIVMCYARLGNTEEANKWVSQAMPQPGPGRDEWVQRMLDAMDERLAELDDIK